MSRYVQASHNMPHQHTSQAVRLPANQQQIHRCWRKVRSNLHCEECSTFDSWIRHDLCCPRCGRRDGDGRENVGDWRGNCLNMWSCLPWVCTRACVCVCVCVCVVLGIEFRVLSWLASMAKIKAQDLWQLITVSGDRVRFNAKPLTHNPSSYTRWSEGWCLISWFLLAQCCCHLVAKSCTTLYDPMDCSTPGFPVLHHLPELAQTHVHRLSEVTQPSLPLSPSSHPVFSLSQHQDLFQWFGFLQQYWPKYWSFSFSISPSNEHSELISFRMDWLDLLAVQGTLKSLLQHHKTMVQY